MTELLTENTHIVQNFEVPVSPQVKRKGRRSATRKGTDRAIERLGVEDEEQSAPVNELSEFCVAYCTSQEGR